MTRRGPLRLLQRLWPIAAAVVIAYTMAVVWFGGPERAAAWANVFPLVSGLIGIMATAAGAGPLVADQIKAKAGVLKE